MLKPTPERIKAVMRRMPKGVKFLDEIQKSAARDYGIEADKESLLETLREIYREGKLEHVRHMSGKDGFRLQEGLKGLDFMPTRINNAMFKDDRKRGYRTYYRGPIVAWLNYRKGVFSVNVVSETLKLTRPIPKHIRDVDEAVDWVLRHSEWVE